MSKSPKKTGSILSRQLLTPLGISLAIVGSTILWINYRFIKTDLEEKVEQRAQSITQGIEFGTEGLIEFEQTSILRRTVQNYATLTNVIEVAVVNPDGLTIANSSEFIVNRPYRSKFSQWMEQAAKSGVETSYKTTIEERAVLVNILPFSSTIFGVSGHRGLIVVILDIHTIQQQARRILFASTATFLVGIILILAILAILLDRKIFRPLQRLHQAIGESKKSNDFVLTQPMPANEIGFLADVLADTFQKRKQIEATLEKQFRRVSFLENITQKIRQSLDIETILHSAANQIGFNFNISYCHIYLYKTKSLPKLPLIAEYVDRDNPSSKNFLSSLEDNNLYIQELLKQDRAIAFADVKKEPLLEEMRPLFRELKIKSMLGVRTSYKEKPNGIIILHQCDRYREWTKSEIELLEAVAAKVGIALAQAQLLKQEKEQKTQLDRQNQLLQQEITEREQAQHNLKVQHLKFQLFAEIALKIRQSLDIKDILQTTVSEVQKILLADRILIYRVEEDGSGSVIEEEVLPEWSSMLDLHCAEEVFPLEFQKQYERNKLVAIESTETAYAEEPCMYDFTQKWSIKAKLIAAIWQEQNLWGFIMAHQCSAPRVWKEFDRKLVQQLADQVGIAITHAQILEKEKELRALKSSFVSMTSHEFRTPLAVIGSSTDLLQHYAEKLDASKKLKHFERIKSSIKHMTALLEDVLMISKVEAHKIDFNPVDIDVIEFCRDLVEELQQSKPEYQILLAIHGLDNSSEPKSFHAQLDPKLLRQILTNLLTNAIKYSPVGSNVYFDLNCEPDYLCFRVRDEGIGIPAEDVKKIFNPFHRAINVGNISGTGLGLAIVHKYVELHQGKITIESEVNVGTTFIVTIPLSAK